MINTPSTNDLLKKIDNRFELVIAASKRAREISDGAEVFTDKKEYSKLSMAADEIANGKVKIIKWVGEIMIELEENKQKLLALDSKFEGIGESLWHL